MGTVAAALRRRGGRLDMEESRERERGDGDPFRWQRRYSWAELMKRAFLVDVLTCPHCGGPRRLLAFVLKPSAIERILSHLGLPTGCATCRATVKNRSGIRAESDATVQLRITLSESFAWHRITSTRSRSKRRSCGHSGN